MEITDYLSNLNTITRHECLFRQSGLNISLLDFRIMDMIFDEPYLMLKDISERRSITPQCMGRVCSRLQDQGLIYIDIDKDDGRARRVSLTPFGTKVHGRATDFLENIISDY